MKYNYEKIILTTEVIHDPTSWSLNWVLFHGVYQFLSECSHFQWFKEIREIDCAMTLAKWWIHFSLL